MVNHQLSRRNFNKLILSGAAGALLESMIPTTSRAAATRRRVVVIGGGFGGATAAKYLRKLDPSLSVTLIEPKKVFHACPLSNWVVAGIKTMQDLAQYYTLLQQRYGVTVLHDTAIAIDAVTSSVKLKSGKVLRYDKLIVSPGIDFSWDTIAGYSKAIAETKMPHGFEAGAQTQLLRQQLLALNNGSNVIICPPDSVHRCPAAPYERASLIALYLSHYKPKSKVIILDCKEKFSMQELFLQGWERLYPGKIEWRAASAGGKIEKVNAAAMTVTTEFGDEQGGVINIMPPQKAGAIAFVSGLTDASGWCPINPFTFESTLHKGIYVIGDACQAGEMPKSALAASSQAKVVSATICSELRGKSIQQTAPLVSTCYSLLGKDYGICVSGLFKVAADRIVEDKEARVLTSLQASREQLSQEAMVAWNWYKNITRDTWG